MSVTFDSELLHTFSDRSRVGSGEVELDTVSPELEPWRALASLKIFLAMHAFEEKN